eukprot:796720_1
MAAASSSESTSEMPHDLKSYLCDIWDGLAEKCRFAAENVEAAPIVKREAKDYFTTYYWEITLVVLDPEHTLGSRKASSVKKDWDYIHRDCVDEDTRAGIKTQKEAEMAHLKKVTGNYEDHIKIVMKKAADAKAKAKAHVGVWNRYNDYAPDLSHRDNQYSPISRWNDVGIGHSLSFDPLFSDHHSDVSRSDSSLLIGGAVGASAIVIIVLIFCLGLAFGMIVYWGYSQKRTLDVKRKKEEMRWIG